MSRANFGHNLNYGDNKSEEKDDSKKDTRNRIVIEFDDDDSIPPTKLVWEMSGQRMCTIISNTLRNVYKDYAGSVFRINNFGMPEFISSFCAEVVNPDAKFKAFEVASEFANNKSADKIRNLINATGFHNSKAYRITDEGVDTLSDLVQAGVVQKDKTGRVKNINNYFWETGNVVVNPYMPYNPLMNYNPNNQVFVEVQLDILRVLKIAWPFFKDNKSEEFRFNIKVLNCNSMNRDNPFLQLSVISKTEAMKTLNDSGIYVGSLQNPYR